MTCLERQRFRELEEEKNRTEQVLRERIERERKEKFRIRSLITDIAVGLFFTAATVTLLTMTAAQFLHWCEYGL